MRILVGIGSKWADEGPGAVCAARIVGEFPQKHVGKVEMHLAPAAFFKADALTGKGLADVIVVALEVEESAGGNPPDALVGGIDQGIVRVIEAAGADCMGSHIYALRSMRFRQVEASFDCGRGEPRAADAARGFFLLLLFSAY